MILSVAGRSHGYQTLNDGAGLQGSGSCAKDDTRWSLQR